MVYRETGRQLPPRYARVQRDMEEWLKEPGEKLFLSEQKALARLLRRTPGENVLQMGLESLDYTAGLSSGRRVWREGIAEDEQTRLIRPLSFADGCMHAVVLPHLLECVAQPVLAMREANRLLRSGGWLFVIGFYPVSPFCRVPPAVRDRRHSPASLIRVLSLLDFSYVACQPLAASPWSWSGRIPGWRSSFILSACRRDLVMTPLSSERTAAEATAPAC